jgi:hypothetical protein
MTKVDSSFIDFGVTLENKIDATTIYNCRLPLKSTESKGEVYDIVRISEIMFLGASREN